MVRVNAIALQASGLDSIMIYSTVVLPGPRGACQPASLPAAGPLLKDTIKKLAFLLGHLHSCAPSAVLCVLHSQFGGKNV